MNQVNDFFVICHVHKCVGILPYDLSPLHAGIGQPIVRFVRKHEEIGSNAFYLAR